VENLTGQLVSAGPTATATVGCLPIQPTHTTHPTPARPGRLGAWPDPLSAHRTQHAAGHQATAAVDHPITGAPRESSRPGSHWGPTASGPTVGSQSTGRRTRTRCSAEGIHPLTPAMLSNSRKSPRHRIANKPASIAGALAHSWRGHAKLRSPYLPMTRARFREAKASHLRLSQPVRGSIPNPDNEAMSAKSGSGQGATSLLDHCLPFPARGLSLLQRRSPPRPSPPVRAPIPGALSATPNPVPRGPRGSPQRLRLSAHPQHNGWVPRAALNFVLSLRGPPQKQCAGTHQAVPDPHRRPNSRIAGTLHIHKRGSKASANGTAPTRWKHGGLLATPGLASTGPGTTWTR